MSGGLTATPLASAQGGLPTPNLTAASLGTPALATPGLLTPGLLGSGLVTPSLSTPGLATPGLTMAPGSATPQAMTFLNASSAGSSGIPKIALVSSQVRAACLNI